MSTPEERIKALDAKIDALRAKRYRLKKRAADRRAKHQSVGNLETELKGLTMQQLRAELGLERRRFTRAKLQRRQGRGARNARARAEVIAGEIGQRQMEHA